jgi:MFS family permease
MSNNLDEFRDDGFEIDRPQAVESGIIGYGRRVFSSFRNPVYRLYYYSLVGHWGPMQMEMVTRTLLIYRLTGSGALLGLMALAGSIPMLILSLYGGALADRLEKRKTLIIGQLASGVLSLGVALALNFNFLSREVPGSWWILMVSSALQGIIMGLIMPSRASMIPEIVEPKDLMNAIALNNMGMNVFRIMSPAAAGFIIEAWDFSVVYYVMTALYILSVVFIFFIPPTPPAIRQGKSTLEEVLDGFRYMRSETTILAILVFTLGCTILGMPFNMLLPMFTEDVLKVGSTGLGILMAVSGVGAIFVSFVLASMPNKKRGLLMLFSGLILSLALVAFSFTDQWYLSLVLAVFIGLGQTGQTAVGFTLIQFYVAPAYRGRALSFMMLGFGLSSLGTVFGGVMADALGIPWSIGGLAIALGALSLAMITFSPRLRRLD